MGKKNSGSPSKGLHNSPQWLCRCVQTFKQTLSWGCETAAQAGNCLSHDAVTDISQVAKGLISCPVPIFIIILPCSFLSFNSSKWLQVCPQRKWLWKDNFFHELQGGFFLWFLKIFLFSSSVIFKLCVTDN